jgi:hypothetical protein
MPLLSMNLLKVFIPLSIRGSVSSNLAILTVIRGIQISTSTLIICQYKKERKSISILFFSTFEKGGAKHTLGKCGAKKGDS